jgi:signal transduction histidine kinase
MNHKSLFLLPLLLFFLTTAWAEEPEDTAFANLYRRYFQLFTDSDVAAFYDASEQLKAYYLERGNKDSYYKVFLNEVLFDTEHGMTYRAIKKANGMLQDMEANNEKHFEVVYSAMANIYDMRGNYRLAYKYLQDALNACAPTDTASLANIYSRIAQLQAHREPQKAWESNETFGKMMLNIPQYRKVYIVQKCLILFYLKDRKHFPEAYQEYLKICKDHPLLDVYGTDMMNILYAVYEGDYNTALEILSRPSPDYDALDRCDMRILIYEMMGEGEKALREVDIRRDLRDSLNSDMLFESINEINAEMGMMKVEEQAHKDKERASKRQKLLMGALIILLGAALGLVVSRYLMRQRMQKQLIKKNKELEIALSRAEESDRMKDSFIQHVSHEIRTPLNVITGYAQIITNPSFELEDDERNRMLVDIGKNTQEITYIVDELLEVAEEESHEYYPKDDTILVNSLCRKLVDDAEPHNKKHLAISFTTEVDDEYAIKSNRRVLEKILIQLFINAMKFTNEGSITLHFGQSPDRKEARFVITDTGIGISAENRKHVFDRFFKADPFKQGFGLGLTVSRKQAGILGGTLAIDDNYTDGTRFVLTLPA